ncbi:MAG: DUF1002 domain-containing protein [Dorea sp.]|nr:DUF1002 domain-containing protein [Dorea sp.]
MKNMKRIIPVLMAAVLTCTGLPLTARADSAKVVTLGANLTAEQKTSMYKYFGTTADAVDTIEVTNADERKYMEGIASEAQIGTRTYSCSYVEPTTSGGIQVKVGNLTFVTSSMIASTLLTSGVENCNVVAASPIEVSGTGALTGIMMAYEKASGKTLSEEQKAAATEELVTTGELADSIGQKDAADLMNEVKQEVIKEGLTDDGEIKDAVNSAANTYNITLTEDQMSKIVSLMQNIAQYDYDVNALKKTLENLEGKGNNSGFFSSLWSSIKGIFTGDSGSGDGGIINDTNDEVLGADAIIDSTLEALDEETKKEGFWDKVTNFFKGLFSGSDDDADEEETDEEADADGEDAEDTENSDDALTDGENTDTDNPDGAADPNSDSALNNADGADPNTVNDQAAPEDAALGDPAAADAAQNGAASDGLTDGSSQTTDPASGTVQ